MPIFEFLCSDCGESCEILYMATTDNAVCPTCGSSSLKKLLSAPAPVGGTPGSRVPGSGDTACCGSSPAQAGCAGPGSCCGKTV